MRVESGAYRIVQQGSGDNGRILRPASRGRLAVRVRDGHRMAERSGREEAAESKCAEIGPMHVIALEGAGLRGAELKREAWRSRMLGDEEPPVLIERPRLRQIEPDQTEIRVEMGVEQNRALLSGLWSIAEGRRAGHLLL